MRKEDVRSVEDALAYITDCNLATVAHMALMKSRNKSEYARQIAIAQQAVDWMHEMDVNVTNTRAADITGTVADWAKQLEVFVARK